MLVGVVRGILTSCWENCISAQLSGKQRGGGLTSLNHVLLDTNYLALAPERMWSITPPSGI